MRVSVVICTLNRVHSLLKTLESLHYQRYDEFEVVVVNGPSNDGTDEALAPWADRVRIEHCPVPNLSVSRNIGIRAAAGDVVAFIDDDALPEFDWLVQALEGFDSDEVAGVGGIVFDHTGMDLQYRYSAANRFAEVANRSDRPFDDQCVPGSFQFPYLQGTNALFRRDALLAVGGFDEVFEYYLDETDLCCRLIDAGYVLRQLPTAPVHHKFLPSDIRDHQRVVTNWFPLVKNQVYFSYRHAGGVFSEADIHEHAQGFINSRVLDAQLHEDAGRLPEGSAHRARDQCGKAFSVGLMLGTERQRTRLGPVSWPAPAFRRFPSVDASARRRLTIVSSGYAPNMTGGIARFISDLAPGLARRGHEVRVVTKAIGPAAVDLEDGVWVHRVAAPDLGEAGLVPDVLPHINAFATAAVDELDRIATWSSHDLVYGPLWDVEVLGVLRRTALPVVVQVATPLAVAGEMSGFFDDPQGAGEMQRLIELEREILTEADAFHANSTAVLDTIAHNYVGHLPLERWKVVHLGLVDHAPAAAATTHDGLNVFFVGRFERRKGIDTLLDAISQVAPEFPQARFVIAGEDRPLDPGQPLYGLTWWNQHFDAPWRTQVDLVGPVTDEQLHQLYHGADLVVLPSRYESFGLVMLEAMMHGRAVISCDTSGVREVVRHGVDGILVQPGDVRELAQAMRTLLDDAGLRHRLGVAGRQRFLDSFRIDQFAERFERFVAGVGIRTQQAAELTAGQERCFDVDPAAAVRVALLAHEPSVVVIDDGSERVEQLLPGRMHRLPLDTTRASVTIRVAAGRVTIAGLIDVRLEP